MKLKVSIFVVVALITGCMSVSDSIDTSQTATHTIEGIRNSCSYFTTIEGCDDLSGKRLRLNGILSYSDTESYHARLYPMKTNVLKINLEEDEDIPNSFPLLLKKRTKKTRINLAKFHGKPVSVIGRAKVNCAVVNTETGGGGIDSETGEIWWIGGYCHTQTDVYFENFEIEQLRTKT